MVFKNSCGVPIKRALVLHKGLKKASRSEGSGGVRGEPAAPPQETAAEAEPPLTKQYVIWRRMKHVGLLYNWRLSHYQLFTDSSGQVTWVKDPARSLALQLGSSWWVVKELPSL